MSLSNHTMMLSYLNLDQSSIGLCWGWVDTGVMFCYRHGKLAGRCDLSEPYFDLTLLAGFPAQLLPKMSRCIGMARKERQAKAIGHIDINRMIATDFNTYLKCDPQSQGQLWETMSLALRTTKETKH